MAPGIRRNRLEMPLPLRLLVFLCSCSAESLPFDHLSLSDGSTLCSLDPPSAVVPVTDFYNYSPSLTSFHSDSCIPALAKCAYVCTQEENCISYNYNEISDGCELFFYTPINYASTDTCSHFKKNVYTGYCPPLQAILTPSAGGNVRKLIPAQCCSFPFTYNGRLYHECAQNATDAVDVGCFLVNRTWVSCMPPTAFVVTYETINISLPNYAGIISVMSVNNWILIQQRLNASPTFSGVWEEYKIGFGNFSGNLWVGLETVYKLTNAGSYRLRIEVETLDDGTWFSTEYNNFVIDSEAKFYAIHVNGYSGDGGDAFNCYVQVHNGMKFTTIDSDNDYYSENCAARYDNAGFWYNACLYFCLTCSTASTRFVWKIERPDGTIMIYQLRSYRMMMKLV